MPDVVIVGAGMVGASCAYYASKAGLSVTVVDRGSVAGGTTSHGEGNLLVSDKPAGPELDLAMWSRDLWLEIGATLGEDTIELDVKGGLVVAASDDALNKLQQFGKEQNACGVTASLVHSSEL